MVRSLLLAFGIAALPAAASAQAWAEAYKAGDYLKAVELLQEEVIKQQPLLGTSAFLDAEPARSLAALFRARVASR